MRTLLVAFALITSVSLCAQSFLVSNFDTAPSGPFVTTNGSWATPVDQFITNAGILSIAPVSGGNPDDGGSFTFAQLGQVYNATLVTDMLVAGRVDAGNASLGFSVILLDTQGVPALFAQFAAATFNNATFTAVPSSVQVHPSNGNISMIEYWGIAGAGSAAAFRFSFDNISAIPEPATYAAIFGLLALGFVAYRRRMQSV